MEFVISQIDNPIFTNGYYMHCYFRLKINTSVHDIHTYDENLNCYNVFLFCTDYFFPFFIPPFFFKSKPFEESSLLVSELSDPNESTLWSILLSFSKVDKDGSPERLLSEFRASTPVNIKREILKFYLTSEIFALF